MIRLKAVARVTLPLVLVLGLIGTGTLYTVNQVGKTWLEKDIRLRAELAVLGAREALAQHWSEREAGRVRKILTDIARDERILGAAACGADHRLFASTEAFPRGLDCAQLGQRPFETRELASGPVHISVVPLVDGDHALGSVALVHDLTFVQRREAMTSRIALLVLAGVILASLLVVTVATRLSWTEWLGEVQALLQGRRPRPEFQPLLRDVRELATRLAAEAESGDARTAWTPERLRQTMATHLHGQKVIAVANREPYIHMRGKDGLPAVLHPASGLVTALEPVMRACSGVWVAHGSGNADRETADAQGRLRVPPGEDAYWLRRVWLSREEERGYYYGFANEGMWPLCHLAHARPLFRSEDWQHYQHVNQRFADAVCAELESDDAVVFVQDYHFALVPRLVRERFPRATILTFWHIPWPNSERFGICPWREELLKGMLGSSILGFHTQQHCNNFAETVDRYLEARLDREESGIVFRGRSTLVRPYPISIEWPSRWTAGAPTVKECQTSVRAELGLPPDALLGMGVDRLDYTKGVEERLAAVERLLERAPHLRGRFTFVQLAAPSRTEIARYRELNESVQKQAEAINARFGRGSYRPIVLLCEHHEPPKVFRYYRAADVCYVSSLHDGMNLVAKEFIAARDDERGVLVLSQFTGAARELTEALVVNPYDIDRAADALAAALAMPEEEQAARMRAMRQLVSEFNVYRWAGRILVDAARLQQRDRLWGRLGVIGERRERALA